MAPKKKNNRILHLSAAHVKTDPRIFEKQAKSLEANNYDVTIIAAESKDADQPDSEIEFIAFSPRGRLFRFTALQLWLLYQSSKKRYAIVHFHDPDLIFVGWILKKMGKTVIYDVHENYQKAIQNKYYLPRLIRNTVAKTANKFEKVLSRSFDAVVLADVQLVNGFETPRQTVIRNFPTLETPLFSETSDTQKPNELNLIYVGSITSSRGAMQMVDIARILNEKGVAASLDLVGTVDEPLVEEVKKSKVADYIKFHGYLDFKEARQMMKNADLGLCILQPTRAYVEAIPVKFLEYLCLGLPVVVSDFPRIRSLSDLEPGIIYVDPQDPSMIADKIVGELRSGKLLTRKGAVADIVREKYGWQTEEKRLLALYQDLLGKIT